MNGLVEKMVSDFTREYYNRISDAIVEDIKDYYNGSLICDITTDPKTFRDQDVENIIKYSRMGKVVLDAGCGPGLFAKRLIEKKPDIDYHGIDISDEQIKNAKIVNPDYADRFIRCDWQTLPYADQFFDTIIFIETIGYARDFEALLKECHRCLKPGGTIFTKHPGIVENGSVEKRIVKESREMASGYGYAEDSLGMLPYTDMFVETIEKNGFDVPDGYIIPGIDESDYIRKHFKPEYHHLIEQWFITENHLSARLKPEIDPEIMCTNMGLLHPHLINNYIRDYGKIDARVDKYYLSVMPSFIVTGYKKEA